MSRNVYWEIYLHFVWRTKDSMPLLTPRIEPIAHKYLVHRALETAGCIVHAVGGIEDHVHMAVSLPPTRPAERQRGVVRLASRRSTSRRELTMWATWVEVLP